MTLEGVDKRSETGYSEQNIVGLITRKDWMQRKPDYGLKPLEEMVRYED